MAYHPSINHPTKRALAVVPSDAVTPGSPIGLLLALTHSPEELKPFDRLYVGVTGHVVIEDHGGNQTTFSNVPVGHLFTPGRRVLGTGTTATNIVAISD